MKIIREEGKNFNAGRHENKSEISHGLGKKCVKAYLLVGQLLIVNGYFLL